MSGFWSPEGRIEPSERIELEQAAQRARKEDSMSTIHYANPDETCFSRWFEFGFGPRHSTVVRVCERSVEAALAEAAQWLRENEPGHFSHPDYPTAVLEMSPNLSESEKNALLEAAETGHTYTESGWLLSREWTFEEFAGEPFETPHFDRYDIAEAWQVYWAAHHQGQGSRGYRNLSRAHKLCTTNVSCFERLSDNGKAIYRKLVLEDGR